jgi:hypothetical protein
VFVHCVYFWLREDLTAGERTTFETMLRTLPSIEQVEHGHIGVPAETDRAIVDRSYSFAEVLIFKDKEGHDAYQVHPTHKAFVDRCSTFWRKIAIYDSVG